ncbi:MAG TPA: class I SAM-dependent methyltransferase [Thermoclostridium sp.]|nr:class I SAM-dependent methyltransferase [Thermoclostridium sp.]
MNERRLEEMGSFFDRRADIYDSHMLEELQLSKFYDAIERCIAMSHRVESVLDLGCGTGLELERLFRQFEDARVTAIDLSEGMLEQLKRKFRDKVSNMEVICGSYFDVDFGNNRYDLALSTYSLHHFDHDEKLSLYQRVYESLKPGGRFINGDYTLSADEEKFYMTENARIREAQGIDRGFFHYDTPMTAETERRLLEQAGF